MCTRGLRERDADDILVTRRNRKCLPALRVLSVQSYLNASVSEELEKFSSESLSQRGEVGGKSNRNVALTCSSVIPQTPMRSMAVPNIYGNRCWEGRSNKFSTS